jgi:hypothetical protein
VPGTLQAGENTLRRWRNAGETLSALAGQCAGAGVLCRVRRRESSMGRLGVCAVLCLLALAGAAAVETGRWRYGSISWKRKSPGTSSRRVVITVESAWRYSHGSMVKFGTDQKAKVGDMIKILASDGQDPLLAFGDGNVTARFDVRVVKVDLIQDLLMGESTFEWDYWARGPWNASLTLCCRVAENQNGMSSIMLESKVDLTDINVHGSPQVRVIPRLALQAFGVGDIQHFEIPAVAAESYGARAGIRWHDPPASYWDNLRSYAANSTTYLGVNATTGLASVNVKCYQTSACVKDLHLIVVVSREGATGMVDFIVRVQKNIPPDVVPEIMMKAQYFDEAVLQAAVFPPTSARQSGELRGLPTVEAFADFPLVLTFLGKDAQAQEIYFEYNMLPVGVLIGTKSLDNPLAHVYAQEIRWTPNATQVGEHYFCGVTFDRDPTAACTPCTPDLANDETSCVPICPEHLRSKPLCFNVHVFANTAPIFSLPLPGDRSRTIDMNEPVEMQVKAGDANWMDPVELAVEGVHPDGSRVTKINSGRQCTHTH